MPISIWDARTRRPRGLGSLETSSGSLTPPSALRVVARRLTTTYSTPPPQQHAYRDYFLNIPQPSFTYVNAILIIILVCRMQIRITVLRLNMIGYTNIKTRYWLDFDVTQSFRLLTGHSFQLIHLEVMLKRKGKKFEEHVGGQKPTEHFFCKRGTILLATLRFTSHATSRKSQTNIHANITN